MKEISTLLKNPNFISLWVSQILSQLTVNILSFVILIRLYEVTNSSIAVSILWIAYALPAIIVGPFAAAFVDLIDKRTLLILTNLLQALIILFYGLFLFNKMVFLAYAVVFLYSFFNQFYVPAEAAAMPLFIPKNFLAQANGLFFITQQSALVLGFGLGGLLVEAMGFRSTLLVASFALFVAFIIVTFLPRQKHVAKLPQDFEDKVGDFFSRILEGYRFIKDNKSVLLPFVLLLGLQVVIAVIITSLPPIATGIVGIKPASSAIAIVLPTGVGAMIATIAVSRLLANKTRKRKIILTSLLSFAILIGGIAVVIPLIKVQIFRVILSVISFIGTGFLVVAVLVPSMTFMQEKTPKELLGRVFGNFWFLTTIVTILPVIFSATITEVLGIQVLILILSGFCFAAYLLSRHMVREI